MKLQIPKIGDTWLLRGNQKESRKIISIAPLSWITPHSSKLIISNKTLAGNLYGLFKYAGWEKL